MTNPSDIRALVVTLDPWLGVTFGELSKELGIETQTSSSRGVPEELGREKFEALFLDFDTVAETAPILATLRRIPSNKGAVVLAVATGNERRSCAVNSGAIFVFERPLQMEEVRRTLRTAYDLMQGDRRRYFRCAVRIPVRMTLPSGVNIDCSTMNLSRTGMALTTSNPIETADWLELAFALPDGSSVQATAVVVWDDKHGKSGLQFQCREPEMQRKVDDWLDSQFAAQRA